MAMVRRIAQTLLVASLMMPMYMQTSSVKKVKNLLVKRNLQVCGNANITGNLTVDGTITCGSSGVNLCSLTSLAGLAGAVGAAGTPGTSGAGLGTLVSSINPFASGVLTLGTFGTIPLTGVGMGFGAATLLTGVAATDEITHAGYSFVVPAAGTLHNLAVSVNAVTTALGLPAATPVVFTIYTSPAPAGTAITPPTYTASTLTATATLPASTALVQSLAASAASATSIPVAAGTRVTIVVTPGLAINLLDVSLLALNAGVMFSPS